MKHYFYPVLKMRERTSEYDHSYISNFRYCEKDDFEMFNLFQI